MAFFVRFGFLEDFNIFLGGTCVLEELLAVFAEEGLGVVAGDIVPDDAVLVDVVQDAHAGLDGLVDVEFGVVGLGNVMAFKLSLVTSVRPGLVSPARGVLVSGGHFDAGAGPEPSVDAGGLEILAVAALEVAETAASPDVGKILIFDVFLDHLIFTGRLQRHKIHAIFSADVSGIKPVQFGVSVFLGLAGEEIMVTVKFEM